MRKLLGILLVLTILLLGAVTAFAETYIEEVDVSGVTVAAGQAMPTTATTGEYATVESVSWEKWNFTTNAWEAASGNFADGNAYRMTAILAPAEGYFFDRSCFYSINGEETDDYAYANDDGKLSVRHAFPVGLTVLEKVEYEKTPEVKAGDDSNAALADLKVADDAHFRVLEAHWQTIVDNTSGSFSGTFEAYGCYELKATLAPKAGYWIGADTRLIGYRVYTYNIDSNDQATMWTLLRYDLRDPVEELNLTVTDSEEGKKASDLQIAVAEEGVSSVTWEIFDADGDPFDGTFGKETYRIAIHVRLDDKHSFQNSFDVYINGEEQDSPSYFPKETLITYWLDHRPAIEKAEVTVTGVEVGKQAEDVKITIPEDAPYKMEYGFFVDEVYNVAAGEIGKRGYTVIVCLTAKEGAFRQGKTVATVNGEKPTYCQLSDDNDVMLLRQEYFFGETLHAFDTGIEKPKAGDPIPVPEWKTSKDGKLEYRAEWNKYENGLAKPVSGSFEDDTLYSLIIQLRAKAGVRFGDDLVATAAGKELGVPIIVGYQAITGAFVPIGDVKLVESIQPSAAQPTAGREPGPISGKGEGYEILSGKWMVSDTEDGERKAPGQTFKAGEYVFLELKCKADQDYVVDFAAKVRLNGKDYRPLENPQTDEEGNFVIVVCLGKLKAAQNPNTGDEAPLVLLSVLSMASVLGMGLLLKRRRA